MTKKNKIKLIIFDCYGLVLNEGFPNTAKALTKKFGGKYQDYYKVMYKKYFNLAAERKVSQKQAWFKTVERFNLPLTWQELRDLHYSLMKVDQRVINLNQQLNSRGYKTLLLSKNTRSQFSDVCRKFGLKNKFKNVINTWELGLPKASQATLKVILKRFKVKPKEIIYADDQMNNLTDARKMGIKTILVKNFKQLKKELNSLLISS
ncbi:HAD-IA family hydrolase [Patescibacteria group bacterium]|nr:HAD-IA family hydrolase [Patescibacteria group bacterium]